MRDWLNYDTWILSDPHIFHDNIIKYCDRPYNCFELIIKNWNKLVQSKDYIFILGDIFFKNYEAATEVMPLLRGHKYFLKGNHDKVKRLEKLGFIHANDKFSYTINGNIYPYETFVDEETNICLIFTHRPLPIKFIESMNWGENKNYNVHGHIHNKPSLSLYRINMCVEVRNYRPWRLKEILDEIK